MIANRHWEEQLYRLNQLQNITKFTVLLIVLLLYLKLTGKKMQEKHANFVTSQNPSYYTNEHDILTLLRT